MSYLYKINDFSEIFEKKNGSKLVFLKIIKSHTDKENTKCHPEAYFR